MRGLVVILVVVFAIGLDQIEGLDPARMLRQIHHADLLEAVAFAQPGRAGGVDSSLGDPHHAWHRGRL